MPSPTPLQTNGPRKILQIQISPILVRLAALSFFALGFIYDIMYLLRYGRDYLDADMASEMVLADLLHQSGSILCTDWAYSSEIRVFEMQWFYRIGLLLSPGNWLYARTIGMALALLLLAASVFLCARAAGWGDLSIWAAGFAMWPLGFWYCWQSTFGGYYLPYAIFSFFSLFCVLKIVSSSQKQKIPFYIFLALLAFSSGLNGVRQLMVLYAPLLLASFFVRNRSRVFPAALYAFFVNALGYLVNMLYLSKRYSYNTQSDYVWGGGTNSWYTSLNWFFESFGYCQNSHLEFDNRPLDIKLFSFAGIAAGLGLMLGYAIFASCIYLIIRFKKLNDSDQFLAAVSLSMLFVVGFVFTYLHGARQYWQQTHAFGFILLLLAVKNIDFQFENIRIGIILLAALFTAVSSKGTVQATVKDPVRACVGMSDVVDWIETNTDYTCGVSSFWYSNLLTELSDGRLEMYTVYYHDYPSDIFPWLQKLSHKETFPDSHYFVLCPHSEEGRQGTSLIEELHAVCIYDDLNYTVYAVE